jgi:hypothetical protein
MFPMVLSLLLTTFFIASCHGDPSGGQSVPSWFWSTGFCFRDGKLRQGVCTSSSESESTNSSQPVRVARQAGDSEDGASTLTAEQLSKALEILNSVCEQVQLEIEDLCEVRGQEDCPIVERNTPIMESRPEALLPAHQRDWYMMGGLTAVLSSSTDNRLVAEGVSAWTFARHFNQPESLFYLNTNGDTTLWINTGVWRAILPQVKVGASASITCTHRSGRTITLAVYSSSSRPMRRHKCYHSLHGLKTTLKDLEPTRRAEQGDCTSQYRA